MLGVSTFDIVLRHGFASLSLRSWSWGMRMARVLSAACVNVFKSSGLHGVMHGAHACHAETLRGLGMQSSVAHTTRNHGTVSCRALDVH